MSTVKLIILIDLKAIDESWILAFKWQNVFLD